MTSKRQGIGTGKVRGRNPLMEPKESLQRRREFLAPRKTVLVMCEGKRSEPEYIRALSLESDVRQLAAVNIILDPDVAGYAPLTLVQHAVAMRKRADEEQSEIDEVWCVFDVEWSGGRSHHPNLTNAIDMAKANSVHVAVSNPTFELWLILHFQDQTGFLLNKAAEKVRASCDGSNDKGVDGKFYMSKRREAMRRASLLDKKHADDQTRFPDNNPSSGMYQLLVSVMPPA